MAKKVYIGADNFTPRELPAGYTQLTHIASNGAQWIDTKFLADQDTRVIMVAKVTTAPTSRNAWLFGARNADATARYEVIWIPSASAYRFYYGTNNYAFSGVASTGKMDIFTSGNKAEINGITVTPAAATFSGANSIYIFSCNGGTTADETSIIELEKFLIYSGDTLRRDYVPCRASDGTLGLYELVNGEFCTNAGSGTFAAGEEYKTGVAKQAKKIYLGDENALAARVVKGYIGVGGVARPVWPSGVLTYYGTITALSVARNGLSAAKVGNYGLFAGGPYDGTEKNTVDAYNQSLTRSTPTGLSVARHGMGAAAVGKYALFAGGYGSSYSGVVDAYNESLTRSTPTALSAARSDLAGAMVGKYALFAGGVSSAQTVDAYNESLTRSTPTILSAGRYSFAATKVGSYAIFAGGYFAENHSTVDAYNESLTRTTPTALSSARAYLAATTVGRYALFGGGSNYSAVVDAYDESLTRTIPAKLSAGRYELAAATIDDYALFAGGYISGGYSAVVDVYDSSLTKSITTPLSEVRSGLAAVKVGNFALFGGGWYSGSRPTVDAYTVA